MYSFDFISSYENIISALKKGLGFLSSLQTNSGEFLSTRCIKSRIWQKEYVRDIFANAVILNSMKAVRIVLGDEITLSNMINRLICFIHSQSEDGFFRFFGKGSDIHFDLDTTSCCLSALRRFGVNFDYYDVACHILRYKRKDGSFFTWIEDRGAPYLKRINDIDWCVNANILFFFSLFGVRLPDTERFISKIIDSGLFKIRSLYYETPLAFVYFLSRVYFELKISPHKSLVKYLQEVNWNNPLDCALILSSSVLLGVKNNFHQMISFLLETQNKQQGWDSFDFFTEGLYSLFRVSYGSEALTTALVLESLSLFLSFKRYH